jgi:4-amino-4-deoxy-L-arabinose transferase-like glycosyltransferase
MKKKVIFFILILAIAAGIFFRAHNLNYPFLINDEMHIAVGILKMHHVSFEFGMMALWNHPPLGRWVQGIFTIPLYDSSFEILKYIPVHLFALSHLAFLPVKKALFAMRLNSLFLGLLSMLFVYLTAKKIYSKETALWATALFSLSLDFIVYSRIIFMEVSMIFFTITSVYVYVQYLYFTKPDHSLKKRILLILFLVSLTFLVNTRQFQPLIIAASLLLHFLVYNYAKFKDVTKTLVASIELITIYVISALATVLFIYSPLPPKEFSHSSILQFGFNAPRILEVLLLRNSYISLLGIIFIIVFCLSQRKRIKSYLLKFENIASKEMLPVFLFVFGFLAMSPFKFVPKYELIRYSVFLLLYLVIIEAEVFRRAVNNKNNFFVVIIVIVFLASGYQIYVAGNQDVPFLPSSNFNVPGYGIGRFEGLFNFSIYDELEKLGNPDILTDEYRLLLFYKGNVDIEPIVEGSDFCNQKYFDYLKENRVLIVEESDFMQDTYGSCESFRKQNFTKVKEFVLKGRYEDYEGDNYFPRDGALTMYILS